MADIGKTYTLYGGIRTGYAPGADQWGVGKGSKVKILNTRNVGGQQYYDIQHIGGGTGWTTAAGLEKALTAPKPVVKPVSQPVARKVSTPVVQKKVTNTLANQKVIPKTPVEAAQKRAVETKTFVDQEALDRQAENARQQAMMEEALKKYEGAIAGQTPMADRRNQLASELGLDQKRAVSTGINQEMIRLQQALSNMPETVASQKRGFDVNASRLAMLQQREMDPVRDSLSDLGFASGYANQATAGAEQELSERMGLEMDQRTLELMPYKERLNLTDSQIAREATGFNQDAQNELQLLRDKLNSGETMMENERNRMFQLEYLENQFDNSLALQKDEQEYNRKYYPQRQIVNTAQGQLVVDPVTGDVISNLGMAPSSGSGSSATTAAILKALGLSNNENTSNNQASQEPEATGLGFVKTPYGKVREDEYADYLLSEARVNPRQEGVAGDLDLDNVGLGNIGLGDFRYNPIPVGMFGLGSQ